VEPDWEKLKDVGRIEIVTHDEDGDARETTIWFVELDGQGFIRTGDTNWGKNIHRNPKDVVLRIEGKEYPLRPSSSRTIRCASASSPHSARSTAGSTEPSTSCAASVRTSCT
jgi:hypothetical protein